MKSAKFDHQRTASLDDALAALGGADGEARIMGGGQSLGPMMNLAEVKDKVVPKMCLISAPLDKGIVHTRTFIPHACHAAIGVLGAVSVATACIVPGTVAEGITVLPASGSHYSIEHPSGEFTVSLELRMDKAEPEVLKAGVIRTARLLSRGEVMIPSS